MIPRGLRVFFVPHRVRLPNGLFYVHQASTASNTVIFMQQMIPHHENAVNMARILLKHPGDEGLDDEVRLLA